MEQCVPLSEQIYLLDKAQKEMTGAGAGSASDGSNHVSKIGCSVGNKGGEIRGDLYDPARETAVRKKLARIICGCGLAPEIVNSIFFKEFCHSLNSGYRNSSYNTLRNIDIPSFYSETKSKVSWMMSGQAKLTIGVDGFNYESGNHAINFVETVEDKRTFKNCMDPDGARETDEFYAEAIVNELEKGAAERGFRVEDFYAGAVGDNVS